MDEMVLEVQVWLNKTYNVGVVEDGNTGQATFKGLIKALQTELGIAADGTFGNGTLNACPNSIREGESNHNLVYILQDGFWCKGYNPGWFDGGFGPKTTRAVKEFQNDAGIAENGIVTLYILQGIMNTDGYKYKGEEGTNEYYKYQVQKNMNAIYGAQIGLTAPNGLWERKSHKNFIKCCQIEWSATPVDGVWGNGTMNKAPTLSKNTSGYTNSKRLLQWGLAINGFYPGDFSGAFGNDTYQAVYDFQNFMCLGADGIAGKNTWAALLSARGNTSRKATAFDTSTRLTLATAVAMKEAGYVDVGRYLTNTPGGTLDKKLTQEELEIIKSVGLNIFPIYQTYGGQASYFTRSQGRKDAREAIKAARALGFPPQATIYFAVDYDALMVDINANILPYFRGIKEEMGWYFKIGVYGPRAVCNRLLANGLVRYSFVADMSNGFTGNIGQLMPKNWAYEQFVETTQAGIGIDKCMVSIRGTATGPTFFTTYENPVEPDISQEFTVFKNIYNLAWNYLEGLSSPASGVYANIFDANCLTLAYFRSESYDADHFDMSSKGEIIESVKGLSWRTIAGPREEALLALVKSTYPDLNPHQISVIDPITKRQLEITHYAATLGACIVSTIGLKIDFLERDIDAFAGWAGDLLQMGGVLQNTLDFGGYNYFTPEDLQTIIGAPANGLQNYHLYGKDGKEMSIKDGGFSQVDLLQDVDAYNISRLYNLAETKLYAAFEDYYNVSKHYKRRYHIFKQQLLKEFDADSIYAVAFRFAKQEIPILSGLFGLAFGKFNEEYIEIVAHAFEDKIETQISIEEYTA